jgi:hypothetical protein
MIFCYSTFFGFHNRACRLLSFTRKLVGGASCSNNSKTGNYSYTAVGSVFQPNRHLSILAGAVGNGSLSHSLISRLIASRRCGWKWISIALLNQSLDRTYRTMCAVPSGQCNSG